MAAEHAATRPSWGDSESGLFQSQFVDMHGHIVHYVDEGAGPILLMLHGNPTWSFVYRQVITLLQGSFRCIALDYPGFGLSTAAEGYAYLPTDHSQVVAGFIETLDLHDECRNAVITPAYFSHRDDS